MLLSVQGSRTKAQSHIFAKRSAPRLMAFGQTALLVVSTGRFAAGVIARSHGRLSARVLRDSPISASLPPNSLPVLRKSPIIPPAPPRLDRSLLSITIDNFPAFSRVCDQQTAAEVAQMKDQMVAVDQAANIGIQFQGKRPSGPAFIIWSIDDNKPRKL